jgi:hypothetical protein
MYIYIFISNSDNWNGSVSKKKTLSRSIGEG